MNKVIGSLIYQFQEFFKTLGPTKKFSIIAAAIIILVAFSVVIFMVNGKSWSPLLTNVPSDQVSSIVAKLNKQSIPFQLRDDGKTILVPSEFLHSTQMTLMSEIGSSQMGSVGLELFDKNDFTMNSYSQKINYQRALQGELMRAINTLSAVKQSKVILALPNKKNFLEDTTPPSASVVVELHVGKTLSPEQVRGIRYLVSNAIEGMDPDRVAVLDSRGKMLTRGSDTTTSGSGEVLELKNKIEGDLEDRIEAMLSKVVGQSKVIARVDATLNNKTTQATEESVDPEKTAIRSQQSEEESMGGSRSNPVGVPGARSNLPGAEDAGQVGFKQDVKKEIKTLNYEIPKTVKNIREGAGGIERLSVAVLVDGTAQTITKADGTTETKWIPRNNEDLQKYESIVKSAIGYNPSRGDTVKIENIPFMAEDFGDADRLLTTLERKVILYALFKWLLMGFSLALFFFIVIRPFMRWITDSFTDSVDEMLPRTIEELEELQSVDDSLPGMSMALPSIEESIDPDKAESELLKERIVAIMEQDGEKAANAFSMWLVRKDG